MSQLKKILIIEIHNLFWCVFHKVIMVLNKHLDICLSVNFLIISLNKNIF
jgi:hypothetical protein